MRLHLLLPVILAMGVTTAACDVAGPSGSEVELCAGVAREYSGWHRVVGSFNTTVGAVRALEPRMGQPQRWPDLAPDHPAVLCYIDGEIPKGPPAGPNGEAPKDYDRAVVAIVDGQSELIIAGYQDKLPVQAP